MCVSFFIISCTPSNIENLKNNSKISIEGTITVTGHTPFQKLAIYIPKYKRSIPIVCKYKTDKANIENNIGNKIKVKGLFQINYRTLANSTKEIPFYSILVTAIN